MNAPPTDRPLRLFVDGHPLESGAQGTRSFLRDLYTALNGEAPEIEIYVGAGNSERIRESLPFLQPERILKYRRTRIPLFRYAFDIPVLLRRHRFDFAHFQYIAPKPVRGCRYVVTTHDLLFKDFQNEFPPLFRWSRERLFRRSLQEAAVRTTVSAYSRQRIAHHYRIPETELHVVPNTVSPMFGQRFTRDEAQRFIEAKYRIKNFLLCVSRFEPRKNQDLLLRSFFRNGLDRQGHSLIFIGARSIRCPHFERSWQNLSSEQRGHVVHLEQVADEDLEALYTAASLSVYPSKGEGFGIPPLEAALCRTPVLCSNATAMADFTFLAPWQFDPEDEHEFDRKLMALLQQPLDTSILNTIRENVLQRYSASNAARQFLQLLNHHRS